MKPIELQIGQKYRIFTKRPAQKFKREHVLTFLGGGLIGALQFDARPDHGTQTFHWDQITSMKRITPQLGVEHFVNRIVREEGK